MRWAKAGPTRGRRSSSAADARLMSTITGGLSARFAVRVVADDAAGVLAARLGRGFFARSARAARAESTAAIWALSARSPSAVPGAVRERVPPSERCSAFPTCDAKRLALTVRTPPPMRATAARNRRAWRSAVVGMTQDNVAGRANRHRFIAWASRVLRGRFKASRRAALGGRTRGRWVFLAEHAGGRRGHSANPKSIHRPGPAPSVFHVLFVVACSAHSAAPGVLGENPLRVLLIHRVSRRHAVLLMEIKREGAGGSRRAHRGPPRTQSKLQITSARPHPERAHVLFVVACSAHPAAPGVLGENHSAPSRVPSISSTADRHDTR